jgi:hypothetical protein
MDTSIVIGIDISLALSSVLNSTFNYILEVSTKYLMHFRFNVCKNKIMLSL